jgi:hypothetical protein
MPQTVTHAYLLGIREARAMHRQLQADCGCVDVTIARAMLDNACQCLAMGFSGDIAESIKGERDFWQGQVKRLMAARAYSAAIAE